MRKKTLDQVAANYSSLLDGVMTVSRSQSYFFLLLPRGTRRELVINGDEPMRERKKVPMQRPRTRSVAGAGREVRAPYYRIAKEMRRPAESISGGLGVMLVRNAPVAIYFAQSHGEPEKKAVLVLGVAR